jgi:hypothetical protein
LKVLARELDLMTNSIRNMKVYFDSLFEHIGLLFYAIGAERGKPEPAEYLSLKKMVEADWGLPSDDRGPVENHLAHHLYSGLRSAFESSINPEHAFDCFRDYYQVHALSCGDALKAKIIATAHSIAREFPVKVPGSGLADRLELLFSHRPEFSPR